MLLSAVDECGDKLATNPEARELVAELVAESQRQGLEPPTAMMLRVVLDFNAIPIRVVPVAELGFETIQIARDAHSKGASS